MLLRLALRPGILGAVAVVGVLAAPPQVELKTAANHAMQYYLSLPEGWNAGRQWPVVVAIEAADRNFRQTAEAFASERGSRPFIIVVPLVLTGGGTAQQHQGDYSYSAAAWARAAQDGNCRFDEDGLTAVLDDVRKHYAGENRAFLTGWEAGGHVVWAQVFHHPEHWRAVAIVSPNFQARCMDDGLVSSDTARRTLPVTVFHGDSGDYWAPGLYAQEQWEQARTLGIAHGFADFHEVRVTPYRHGPLPHEVLHLFSTMLGR